jgi:hypothetical protein
VKFSSAYGSLSGAVVATLIGVMSSTSFAADRGFVSGQVENDLFGGNTDKHYTHGMRLSYLTPKCAHEWLWDAAKALQVFPVGNKCENVRMAFSLGQSIFTPNDISDPLLIADDRPYAGWLFLGAGLVAAHDGRLDKLELNIGIVGPASQSERTQKWWHNVIDVRQPRGWDNQLKNEPGFILSYESQSRVAHWHIMEGLAIDVTPHGGVSLGNVLTYGGAGATIRFGHNLFGDYGPPRIRPSLPGIGFFEYDTGFAWYVFAGIEGRVVGRNIFLDGNTFADSHSVKKRRAVGDAQLGFSVAYGRVRLSFTQIFRTEEFKGQVDPDAFGSINISIRL